MRIQIQRESNWTWTFNLHYLVTTVILLFPEMDDFQNG